MLIKINFNYSTEEHCQRTLNIHIRTHEAGTPHLPVFNKGATHCLLYKHCSYNQPRQVFMNANSAPSLKLTMKCYRLYLTFWMRVFFKDKVKELVMRCILTKKNILLKGMH